MPSIAGFGWGRAHFLHSSSYGAIIGISAENGVDSIEMFLLLPSSTCTASWPFLLLILQKV